VTVLDNSWLLLVMASACQSGTAKTTAGITSGGRPTTDAGKTGTLPAVWGFDDEDDAGRPADPAAIKAWLSEIAGVYGSWAEFRYWILVALEHARERYPDRYQALLADATLRKAFTAIDDNWLALFGRVRERLVKEVPQLLQKKNIATGFIERAVPTDRNLPGTWFRVGQTLIYLGDRQLRLLVPVMQQKKYVDLATALRTKAAGPLPAALPTGP